MFTRRQSKELNNAMYSKLKARLTGHQKHLTATHREVKGTTD